MGKYIGQLNKQEIKELENYLNNILEHGTEAEYKELTDCDKNDVDQVKHPYRVKFNEELQEYRFRPVMSWETDRYDFWMDLVEADNFRFNNEKPKRTVARQIAEIECLDWY